jgi:hypothetical protein
VKPLERSLLATISRRLKKLQQADPTLVWRKRHGTSFGIAGDPDLYGVWGGVPWTMELKRPGEEPTALQRVRLEEWRRAGAWVGVVSSTAELEKALAEIATLRRCQ